MRAIEAREMAQGRGQTVVRQHLVRVAVGEPLVFVLRHAGPQVEVLIQAGNIIPEDIAEIVGADLGDGLDMQLIANRFGNIPPGLFHPDKSSHHWKE